MDAAGGKRGERVGNLKIGETVHRRRYQSISAGINLTLPLASGYPIAAPVISDVAFREMFFDAPVIFVKRESKTILLFGVLPGSCSKTCKEFSSFASLTDSVFISFFVFYNINLV